MRKKRQIATLPGLRPEAQWPAGRCYALQTAERRHASRALMNKPPPGGGHYIHAADASLSSTEYKLPKIAPLLAADTFFALRFAGRGAAFLTSAAFFTEAPTEAAPGLLTAPFSALSCVFRGPGTLLSLPCQ